MINRLFQWAFFIGVLPSLHANIVGVPLGAAASFAILAGSTFTNTGQTVIGGDVGVWPGTTITGFLPGVVTPPGAMYTDAVAQQAQSDLAVGYGFVADEPCGGVLTGQDLGGLTLTPGVYCFASSAQLTGTLTLNALGDSNALFLFQVGSALTTAANSSVIFTNGGLGDNVFWQVGSSAVLGTASNFSGSILAFTSITLNAGANIDCGRALAQNGAVTTNSSNVFFTTAACQANTANPAPEIATGPMFLLGTLGALVFWRRWMQSTPNTLMPCSVSK